MPTITDVAKQAGVSASTVSLVLRGSAVPSERARRRVFEAVQKLKYVPNSAARNLRQGAAQKARSGCLAFVSEPTFFCEDLQGAAFSSRQLMLAVLEAQRRGLHLLVHPHDPSRDGQICRPVIDGTVNGMLAHLMDQSVALEASRHVPVVLYNSPFQPGAALPTVNLDERVGIARIVELLAARGHRSIGYFRPASTSWQYPLRWDAFRTAMQRLGLKMSAVCDRHWEITPASHTEVIRSFAAEVAREVRGGGMTALVTPADVYAFGILGELRALGIESPRDLALTGFDDDRSAAWAGAPLLTSVRYPFVAIFRVAFDLLEAALAGRPAEVGEVLVPGEVVERETTDLRV